MYATMNCFVIISPRQSITRVFFSNMSHHILHEHLSPRNLLFYWFKHVCRFRESHNCTISFKTLKGHASVKLNNSNSALAAFILEYIFKFNVLIAVLDSTIRQTTEANGAHFFIGLLRNFCENGIKCGLGNGRK